MQLEIGKHESLRAGKGKIIMMPMHISLWGTGRIYGISPQGNLRRKGELINQHVVNLHCMEVEFREKGGKKCS